MAVVKFSPPSPTTPQFGEKAQDFKMMSTLTQQLCPWCLSLLPSHQGYSKDSNTVWEFSTGV